MCIRDSYYYDAYLQAYNLTNTQMGSLGSIFGVFGMISYLFGGVVADFISPKKLISISLILTGVAGFCHLFATNYSCLLYTSGRTSRETPTSEAGKPPTE